MASSFQASGGSASLLLELVIGMLFDWLRGMSVEVTHITYLMQMLSSVLISLPSLLEC